jgi:hypothetical protein
MGSKLRPNTPIDKDKFYLGQYWASDFTGEKVDSIIFGYKYAGVFIERKSRFKESYFLTNKNTQSLIQMIKIWDREHLSRWKFQYLTVRNLENFFFHLKCDNLEFRIPEVLEYLYTIGVRPHFTCPGHSSENGLAERAIGVIDTKERTFRIAESKPDEFWACSWRLSTQISNIIPYQYRGRWHVDPYRHYYGQPFSYKRLRRPLQKCFVLIRERVKSTEVLKSYLAYFTGYADHSHAYEVFIPATGLFTTSGDIFFPHATEDTAEDEEDTVEYSASNKSVSDTSGTTAGDPPQQLHAQAEVSTAGDQSLDRYVQPQYLTDWKAWFENAMKLIGNF